MAIEKKMSETTSTTGAEKLVFSFLTPAAARAAAQVIEAQLKPFKTVKSKVRVEGSEITIELSGPVEGRGTTSMCARRLAELMGESQKI